MSETFEEMVVRRLNNLENKQTRLVICYDDDPKTLGEGAVIVNTMPDGSTISYMVEEEIVA